MQGCDDPVCDNNWQSEARFCHSLLLPLRLRFLTGLAGRLAQRRNRMRWSEAHRKFVFGSEVVDFSLFEISLTQITRSGFTKTSIPSTSSNITNSMMPPYSPSSGALFRNLEIARRFG